MVLVWATQELKQLMAENGGRFENYYSRAVTHIVCCNLPDSKVKHHAHERNPPPTVRPEWVVDSLAAGRLLPVRTLRTAVLCHETNTQFSGFIELARFICWKVVSVLWTACLKVTLATTVVTVTGNELRAVAWRMFSESAPHRQVTDYALWRLRDKPGQRTLAAFSAQPLSRSAPDRPAASAHLPVWAATGGKPHTPQNPNCGPDPVSAAELGGAAPPEHDAPAPSGAAEQNPSYLFGRLGSEGLPLALSALQAAALVRASSLGMEPDAAAEAAPPARAPGAQPHAWPSGGGGRGGSGGAGSCGGSVHPATAGSASAVQEAGAGSSDAGPATSRSAVMGEKSQQSGWEAWRGGPGRAEPAPTAGLAVVCGAEAQHRLRDAAAEPSGAHAAWDGPAWPGEELTLQPCRHACTAAGISSGSADNEAGVNQRGSPGAPGMAWAGRDDRRAPGGAGTANPSPRPGSGDAVGARPDSGGGASAGGRAEAAGEWAARGVLDSDEACSGQDARAAAQSDCHQTGAPASSRPALLVAAGSALAEYSKARAAGQAGGRLASAGLQSDPKTVANSKPGSSAAASGRTAEQIAAAARATKDILKGPPRSSRDDPAFQQTFWAASRLHFIGSWKARLRAAVLSPAPSICHSLRFAFL